LVSACHFESTNPGNQCQRM